jgi:hypothetical protein
MNEGPRLDPQTRHWLNLEVSRRRKQKELHVGRPVLHRYSQQVESAAVESTLSENLTSSDRETASGTVSANARQE